MEQSGQTGVGFSEQDLRLLSGLKAETWHSI
jgi:hypothetical protein